MKHAEARRRDLLAIRQPFVSAWWPESKETASPAQKASLEWREMLDDVLRQVRQHYSKYRDADRLRDLPLAKLAANSGLGGDELLEVIDHQIETLRVDHASYSTAPATSNSADMAAERAPSEKVLDVKSVNVILRHWVQEGWHNRLKEARLLKQESHVQAAIACGLAVWQSRRTPIESGRQHALRPPIVRSRCSNTWDIE